MMLTQQSRPTRTRAKGDSTAAVWVAGTGAFLLVAAAAVFVAYRWDQLPDSAKLGIVGALTGACMATGRSLRRRLPATGDVLFHLGAFLLPIDLAGLCVRAELGWREILLAEGLLGTAVLGGLALATGSVVLGWAGGLSMLVTAAGAAALSPVAAPLVLAVAAVGATIAGWRRVAVCWATIAGLAPVGAAVARWVMAGDYGDGVMVELGLAGQTAAYSALASGLVAAGVLGWWANARRDLLAAGLAGVSLVSGAAAAWAAANPSAEVNVVGAAALFVAIEVVATATTADAFWRRVTRPVALAVEIVAAAGPGWVAGWVAMASPFAEDGFDFMSDAPGWTPRVDVGIAFGLAAVAWTLAAWRRRPATPTLRDAVVGTLRDDLTAPLAALCVIAGVAAGSASTYAVAAALLAVAVGHGVARGVATTATAALAAVWAPCVLAIAHPLAAVVVAVLAAGSLALTARRSARSSTAAVLLASASLLPMLVGAFVARDMTNVATVAAGAAIVVWLVALAFEQTDAVAGHVVRAALAGPAMVGIALAAGDGVTAIALVAALVAIDAIRLDQPRIALGTAVLAPFALLDAAELAGISDHRAGVLLCVAAAVPAGLAALLPSRWREPLAAAVATTTVTGLVFAATDAAAFADALLAVAAIVVVAGVATRNLVVGNAGGAVAVAAIALRVADAGVTASEAYLAPACAQLVVLGWTMRRSLVADDAARPSSWVAYAPAVGLLGGAGIAERIAGGDSWHALVAGAVGVLAVAAGGWRRLAGPLFLGTALLVTVTVFESLAQLAGVPTWAWLALGGSGLLATGIAIERTATSPLEAGRRLVDVIAERYE